VRKEKKEFHRCSSARLFGNFSKRLFPSTFSSITKTSYKRDFTPQKSASSSITKRRTNKRFVSRVLFNIEAEKQPNRRTYTWGKDKPANVFYQKTPIKEAF